MSLLALLRRLLDAGTQHVGAGRAQRRLVVNNGIALALMASGLGYAALLPLLGFALAGAALVPVCCSYLGAIALNHHGRRSLSRLVMLVAANTTVFGYLAAFGLAGEVTVFFTTVSLPLVICELEERGLIAFGIALSIGYAVAVSIPGAPWMAAPALSPSAERWVRTSLLLSSFAVLLLAILSFVVSNARAEAKLDAARGGVQALLDSADQGFVHLDAGGCIGRERSAVFDRWFGSPPAGTAFAACLERRAPEVGATFRFGWSQLEDGFLPVEILVDQLPAAFAADGRHHRIEYRPRVHDGRLTGALVVISDVTAEVERERLESQERELLALLGRFARDRSGFEEFVAEAERLVAAVAGPPVDAPTLRRALHTLKGNCALFGVQSLAGRCHAIEERLHEGADIAADVRALATAWRDLRTRMDVFLDHGSGNLAIPRRELERVLDSLAAGAPIAEIAAILEEWTWEPTAQRLAHAADQVRALALRLGKGEVDVTIDDGDVRLAPGRWAGFWSAFGHAVRNAVDHGIETPAERAARGKATARITLRTRVAGRRLHIEIEDDGRGIDWGRVARKARARGLPAGNQDDLTAALLRDDFSTRDEVTDISGRGVGLGAIRRACEERGGTLTIDSRPGAGTRFCFSFPADTGRHLHGRAA